MKLAIFFLISRNHWKFAYCKDDKTFLKFLKILGVNLSCPLLNISLPLISPSFSALRLPKPVLVVHRIRRVGKSSLVLRASVKSPQMKSKFVNKNHLPSFIILVLPLAPLSMENDTRLDKNSNSLRLTVTCHSDSISSAISISWKLFFSLHLWFSVLYRSGFYFLEIIPKWSVSWPFGTVGNYGSVGHNCCIPYVVLS